MPVPLNYNKNKHLQLSVSLSMVTLGLGAGVAAAQHETVEEIVVTGSRLLRRDFSAPSPIVTLDDEEIRLAGAVNAEELLNSMPQVIPDVGRTTNTGPGIAAINLRGLGTNRTLVMLNGRRFAPSGVEGSVDINAIPAALTERIEVVTGGTSTVYGSDAVVGVVNFVLDDRFEGIEINAQYDVARQGDADVFDLSISGGKGFAAGRGHLAGFFNYNERQAVQGGAREFTSTVIEDDTTTGELEEAGSFWIPRGMIAFPDTIVDGVPVPLVMFNPDGTLMPMTVPDDLYNYAPDNYLQTPMERYVAAGFAGFELTPELDSSLELMYSRTRVDRQLAPVPIVSFVTASIESPFLPASTRQVFRDSFDPDGDGLAEFLLGRRMSESAPRRLEDSRDSWRLLAALDGDVGQDWQWQAYYLITDTEVDPLRKNDISASRFAQSLLIDPATGGCLDPAGGCVPANVFGEGNISAQAVDFIRYGTIEDDEKVREQAVSATVTGDLLRMPAGALGIAAGIEWRRLEASRHPDPVLGNDDSLGFRNFQPTVGATEVSEVFAELLVPLVADADFAEYLAIELGGRYSEYNAAGTVSTWKLGGEWMPIDGLRFRAMYQRAVRAPSILEAFEVPLETVLNRFTAETDLCSASRDPVGNGLADVCLAQGLDPALLGVFEPPDPNFVQFFIGGNPDLEPEESDSITAGVVWTPPNIGRLSASLDYFIIEIRDAIIDLEAGALAACFFEKDPSSNLCEGYVRDPSGRIAEANNYPRNVAVLETEGIDVQLVYAFDAASLTPFDSPASFDLTFYGTWYVKNGSQASPVTPFFDCAGFFGPTCAFSNFGTLPEFKTSTRLTWNTEPMQVSLRWRWIDGMQNSEPLFTSRFGLPDPVLAIPSIGSTNYVDLTATYGVTDSVAVYGGIINVLEEDPPLLAGASPGPNTDPATFDVLGRQFFLGLTLRY